MAAPVVDLSALLLDARRRTLALLEDLSDEQLIGPHLDIVNPLLWEIGHLAWFQEKWALRELRGERPLWEQADGLYDSAGVAHNTRWSLSLPSRAETLAYMRRVLECAVARLAGHTPSAKEFYFYHLAAYHEDMHGEAIVYSRQTLAYPAPPCTGRALENPSHAAAVAEPADDVQVPGGLFMLGANHDDSFVFDNEKWAHEVAIRPFAIARTQVTNGDFAKFVEDGGYLRQGFWSEAGWKWREAASARHPVYWLRDAGGGWHWRRYDRIVPLEARLPVLHVNWYEADAYCRWAARRLPNEAEWEAAASAEPAAGGTALGPRKRKYPWGDEPPAPHRAHLDGASDGCIAVDALAAGDSAFGCRQMIGNTWEWTASDFGLYPGFTADPYKEYSEPWFGGSYKVLRGGAFATRGRLVRNTYRNFFTPDRRDILAGFRTCRP
jgi:iron(II)-dependent oxidoreductase